MSRGLIVGLVLGVTIVRIPVDAAAPEGMMFIRGGEFDMGDHHDGMPDALPVHAVYLDSFYMDVYEVTNQRYCSVSKPDQGRRRHRSQRWRHDQLLSLLRYGLRRSQ